MVTNILTYFKCFLKSGMLNYLHNSAFHLTLHQQFGTILIQYVIAYIKTKYAINFFGDYQGGTNEWRSNSNKLGIRGKLLNFNP